MIILSNNDINMQNQAIIIYIYTHTHEESNLVTLACKSNTLPFELHPILVPSCQTYIFI